MTKASSGPPLGRPREFDLQAALEAALGVFWRGGYATTSLDDLTAGMGLSRSSFYAAFGSKHEVLLAALRHYVAAVFARLEARVTAAPSPLAALRGILREIAAPDGGPEGCLLVNSITELLPGDAEVQAIAQGHVTRVLTLIGGVLVRAGHTQSAAMALAGTALSCGFGATTLRKSGVPPGQIEALVEQFERLFIPAS